MLRLAQTETEIFDELKANTDREQFLDMQERGIYDQFLSIQAASLAHDQRIADEWVRQTNLVTATDSEYIKKLATPLYVWRTSSWSLVILTFRRARNQLGEVINADDINIPANTIIEAGTLNPKEYITIEDAWIYEGEDYCKLVGRSVNPGVSSAVLPNQLTIISKNAIPDVTVTNEQSSWGGYDEETTDEIKKGALSSRMLFDKVTDAGIRNQMAAILGIPQWRYNLVDNYVGPGTGAIYFDTDVDEEMELIQKRVELAEGIMKYVGDVEELPVKFKLEFAVAQKGDILPNVRDQLRIDGNTAFLKFVTRNGVGQKFYLSHAASWLVYSLEFQYKLYSVKITHDADENICDADGNIMLEDNQVIRPTSVVVSIDAS